MLSRESWKWKNPNHWIHVNDVLFFHVFVVFVSSGFGEEGKPELASDNAWGSDSKVHRMALSVWTKFACAYRKDYNWGIVQVPYPPSS